MEIDVSTVQGKTVWTVTPSNPDNWISIRNEHAENFDWTRYVGTKRVRGLAINLQEAHEITDAEHQANLQRYLDAWEAKNDPNYSDINP